MTEPDPHLGETGYDLVMPFVTVASKGGPHEDQAYTAGWEMGALHALLSQERDHPHVHVQTVRADNREQADLIAMDCGYTAMFSFTAEGWLLASFARLPPDAEAQPRQVQG